MKPLSGTAEKLDQIKKSTNWEFLKATKDNEKLPTAMRRAAQERMGWITGPPEYYYSTEDVEAAKREAQGAVELSDTLGRPGRYFAESTPEEHALTGRENKGKGERAGGSWFSISAQKGNIAEQFPWFKDTSASEVKAALEAGKGAAYNKIVGKIARGIEGERLAAEPILKEYEPKLRDAAANVKNVDPELSQALTDIADRKMRVGATGLKKFLEEKLDDASQAAEFSKAFDEATGEATETAEAAGSSDQPREPLSEKEIEGALPGMSGHIREQQAAAGTEQARKLTEHMNRPAESIEGKAGEMESRSPLFRGTAASPQNEMFQTGKKFFRVTGFDGETGTEIELGVVQARDRNEALAMSESLGAPNLVKDAAEMERKPAVVEGSRAAKPLSKKK